jgi:hypothetical protein
VYSCPPEAPYACPGGQCVVDATECPRCFLPEYPFACPDGRCVAAESDCLSSVPTESETGLPQPTDEGTPEPSESEAPMCPKPPRGHNRRHHRRHRQGGKGKGSDHKGYDAEAEVVNQAQSDARLVPNSDYPFTMTTALLSVGLFLTIVTIGSVLLSRFSRPVPSVPRSPMV